MQHGQEGGRHTWQDSDLAQDGEEGKEGGREEAVRDHEDALCKGSLKQHVTLDF